MSADAAAVVRGAAPADLARICAIENRSFHDPWSTGAILEELATDALRLPLVAEIEGEIAGFLMAWRVADQLHILNIAVDPVWRRRKVAAALLFEAVRLARLEGLTEVTLEVRRSNTPALTFYRRYGFQETGVRPHYYADNGEDAIIMQGDLEALA